ncbi:MAG: TRAP transporter small permease [Candidatus Rokubacteria bacterium]|nr:TRAP transporter small permease [Candidatus Rokubacteria bacterium]
MRRLVRCLEALSDAGGYAAGITVFGLTLLISAGVFSRRVLGSPLLAVDEVSGYLLLAIVFLGLAYTMKAGGHIRSDIVLAHVPAGVRGGLEVLATLLALLFALALLGGNWVLIAEYYGRGTLSFKYLQIPLWIPASLLVVGVILLLLQLVARFLRQVARGSG